MQNQSYTPAMQRELVRYRDVLPAKLEFEMLSRVLDGFDLDASVCLDVGLSSPVMSYALRRLGGAWATVTDGPAEAERFSAALDTPVSSLSPNGELPFDEKQFDILVLGQGQLTGVPDELEFLRECHRVLKPTGSLIFSLEHAKPRALANLIKRMVLPAEGVPGLLRRGYTERELFDVIKTGFDVFSIRTYCRFWVTLVRIWEQARLRKRPPDSKAWHNVRHRAGRLYRIAYQLDGPLFWTRGYSLMVYARRHVWRDRNAPVLRDGRTITEAVLSRPAR